METMEACPVCGTENKRISSTECVGIVEDHYICPNCGYFREMAYSPMIEGVVVPNNMDKAKHESLYGQIIKAKQLTMYDSSILNML